MKGKKGIGWKKTGTYAALVGALVLTGLIGWNKYNTRQLADSLAAKVVRFHVLANSDSDSDQKLKLIVRDAVGSYMHEQLIGTDSRQECLTMIRKDLKNIEEVAETTIRSAGYDYPVRANLEYTDFPEKTYGEYTFPAGDYQALRLVIGEGKGQNWWCVMYPNMCFFNSVYQVVDEKAQQELQKVLTRSEYQQILEQGNFRVKFRWLSFLYDR